MESHIDRISVLDPEIKEKPEYVSHERILEQVDRIYATMSKTLGEGKTAEVVFLPKSKSDICYKIIAEKRLERMYEETFNAPPYNDPKLEAYYFSLARTLESEVRVPKPLCYWEGESDELGKFKILVLEKLNAYTIQDVLWNAETLGEDFDIDLFSQQLNDFVSKMNETGLHHNDIAITNIMIERGTNRPCVIDFGDSDKEFGQEEKPFLRDKIATDQVLKTLQTYIRNKKQEHTK